MAVASTQYLTRNEWHTQDSLLRSEFGKLHKRIDTTEEKLNRRFNKVEEDVAVLKEDVAVLKEDSIERKVDFRRIEGKMHNRSIRNPIVKITPIPIYQLGVGATYPNQFPTNARDFWKLKSPTSRQLALLIYLAKFYDIQGYKSWEQADIESFGESIESSSEDSQGDKQTTASNDYTLEDAVKRYPHMAVDALATLLGLEEKYYIKFLTEAAERRERQQTQATKRVIDTILRSTKRQREMGPTLPPPPKPSSSLMRRLTRPEGSLESLGPSEQQTQLGWAHYEPTMSDILRQVEQRQEAEMHLGSPTEPNSNPNKPPSKESLASRPKGASPSGNSNVSS